MVGLQGDNIQTENNDHCFLILFSRHNHYVFEGHKMVRRYSLIKYVILFKTGLPV